MTSSKFIIIAAIVAVLACASQAEDSDNQVAAADLIAANPKLALPFLGSIPSIPVAGIKPPVPATGGVAPPKLPGNLGINGNKWGSSLLAPLEGYLGGLIGTIPLPRGRGSIGLQQPSQNANQGAAQNGLEK